MSKTKEDIVGMLCEDIGRFKYNDVHNPLTQEYDNGIERAKLTVSFELPRLLDEYAQQVSVNFFYWVQVHATPCTSEDKWWLGDKKYTIPQLFTLFKNQQK